MSFFVTILGSSSALPTSDKFTTAHVIRLHERFFLIDCGEGTQIQLRKYHVKFGKINHIFISHLHGDHVFGIFGLLNTFSLLGRKQTLHIYGHAELQQILDFHREKFGKDISFSIEFHPIHPKKRHILFEDEKVIIEAFPLKHRISCSGFLVKEKERARNIRKETIEFYRPGIKDIMNIKNGADYTTPDGEVIPNHKLTLPAVKPRTYAFCTDTLPRKQIIPIINQVDLLYHEATFLERDKKLAAKTYHSTAKQAAAIAREAMVGKLIIGHFSTRYKGIDEFEREAREVFIEAYAVKDGQTFEIPEKRVESN